MRAVSLISFIGHISTLEFDSKVDVSVGRLSFRICLAYIIVQPSKCVPFAECMQSM